MKCTLNCRDHRYWSECKSDWNWEMKWWPIRWRGHRRRRKRWTAPKRMREFEHSSTHLCAFWKAECDFSSPFRSQTKQNGMLRRFVTVKPETKIDWSSLTWSNFTNKSPITCHQSFIHIMLTSHLGLNAIFTYNFNFNQWVPKIYHVVVHSKFNRIYWL